MNCFTNTFWFNVNNFSNRKVWLCKLHFIFILTLDTVVFTYIYVMCITKICYIWFWNLCKFINTISLHFLKTNMVSIVHTNWTFVIYLFLHSFVYFTACFALNVKATLDFKFDTKISFLHQISQKHLLILNMFRPRIFFLPC